MGSSAVTDISLESKEKEKKKKVPADSFYKSEYSCLVTQPSNNPAKTGLNLIDQMRHCCWCGIMILCEIQFFYFLDLTI